MKTMMLATALLSATALPAHAINLVCGAAKVTVGDADPDPNLVGRIDVRHYAPDDAVYPYTDHWTVRYIFKNGRTVERGAQYDMKDLSYQDAVMWGGDLKENPKLHMLGTLRSVTARDYLYRERVYDTSKGDLLIVDMEASCTRVDSSRTVIVSNPPNDPVTPNGDAPEGGGFSAPIRTNDRAAAVSVVKLVSEGGTFRVPVTINGQLTLKFVIDSGAADVSIPADVVMTLVRTETISDADFLGKETYRLADGSTVPSQRFVIRSLKVGDKTLENVIGSIAPIAGDLLLSQSFLSRFQSWAIANQRQALIVR